MVPEAVAQAQSDLAAASERQKIIDALKAKETAALERHMASHGAKKGRPEKAFAQREEGE